MQNYKKAGIAILIFIVGPGIGLSLNIIRTTHTVQPQQSSAWLEEDMSPTPVDAAGVSVSGSAVAQACETEQVSLCTRFGCVTFTVCKGRGWFSSRN